MKICIFYNNKNKTFADFFVYIGRLLTEKHIKRNLDFFKCCPNIKLGLCELTQKYLAWLVQPFLTHLTTKTQFYKNV